MGTDIHIVVQAKRNDSWEIVNCPKWFEQSDFDREYNQWYSERNYQAFAILGNVRNFYNDPFIPVVSEKRDVDEYLKHKDLVGDHSFHWLTLKELVDYPHWVKLHTDNGGISTTYAECADGWYEKFIPALRRWAIEENIAYENIHIIFGFDS